MLVVAEYKKPGRNVSLVTTNPAPFEAAVWHIVVDGVRVGEYDNHADGVRWFDHYVWCIIEDDEDPGKGARRAKL